MLQVPMLISAPGATSILGGRSTTSASTTAPSLPPRCYNYIMLVSSMKKPLLPILAFSLLFLLPLISHAAVFKISVVPAPQTSQPQTSVTIYWTSSSKEPSAITYGVLSSALINSASDPTPTTFHALTLSPLVKNTLYYFHIVESVGDKAYLTSTFTTSLGASSLPPFTKNLKLGDSGTDVKNLQIFLNRDTRTQVALSGAGSPGKETLTYGPATGRAVSKLQELYRSEILTPNKLTKGTGSFATATRTKVNSLLSTVSKGGGTLSTTKPGVQNPVYSGSGTQGGGGSGGLTYSPSPSPSPSPTPGYTPPAPGPTPPSPGPLPTPPSPPPPVYSPPPAPVAGSGWATCSDGIDNDGDGKIDTTDFDCFGPNMQENSVNYGWT